MRPGFLAYEIGLAAALSAACAALSAVAGMPAWLVAVLVVADLALVALRRRFPAPVLIVAAVLTVIPDRSDFPLAVGLAYAAGYRIRGPWRLTAALGAALLAQVGGTALRERPAGPLTLLFAVGIFLVVTVFPATLAQLSAQRRRILTLMHERTVFLGEQQRIIAERARTREANRIAREMHDSLGHRLTLISLYAGALRSAPTADTVKLLHATSVSAMDELRQILAVLRAEPDAENDGDHDMDQLVAEAQAAGAQIKLERSGDAVEVPAMIEHAAYRTLQEGITNALRHAQGGEIRAAVRFEEGALVVEVENEPGRGQDGTTGGQGLYGLAERVRLAGGVLYHGPRPGGGFRLAATLPLTRVEPTPADDQRTPSEDAGVDDEFGEDLRRADRRRRIWTATVTLSALLVVALCSGGLWIAMRQQTVSGATFDRVRVGETADRVRKELPDPDTALDPGKTLPAPPPGGDCVAYRAAPTLKPADVEGYRFCFGDGTLISKEELADVG
ncbi:sensor histidine kinase [Actinoplanes sp. NPDC049265]|uniref:sensor histidine kinase n=1 Tax=Actinoplanes sp. NPDC049265 TaxID=3363902 RepID=UPI0037181A6F